MTEAAKREVPMEDDADSKIATDDPLFELSQIMGLDGDAPAEPGADIDPQIDLEDALLAEMSIEPEVDAPSMVTDDPAPTAESLEDELTTMLGGAVSVAAEVPAPDVETEAVQDVSSESGPAAELVGFENVDDELEAAQLSEAVADTEIALDELPEELEAVAAPEFTSVEDDSAFNEIEMQPATEVLAEEAADTAEFETPFDNELDVENDLAASETEIVDPLEEVVEDSTLSLAEAEMELEKDFAAFFDEELPDADLGPDMEAGSDSESELQVEPELQPEADVTAYEQTVDPMEELAGLAVGSVEPDQSDMSTYAEAEADDVIQSDVAEPEVTTAEDVQLESDAYAEPEPEPELESEMASASDVEAVSADIAQLNAGLEKIFGEQVSNGDAVEFESSEPATPEPELPAAPVLETTDMSSYEAANAIEVDVPELPDLENEFVAAFENDTLSADADAHEDDNDEPSNDVAAAIGATVAAAGATVLSRSAGETAMAADEEAFDETRFEAELARDMEFVGHDLGNSDDHDTSFEQALDDQAFAAQAAENKPAKRGLVIAAVLGCVAIAGAAGIFAYSNSGVGGTDGPILVETSPDPVKIEPENPGGKLVPNQDRAVFAENVVVPEQEALVPGVEEPVDIAAVPKASLPSSLNGGDAAQKGEDRLIPEATEATGGTDEIGALLAPRKVRTLVVRPDGTLVERTVVPTPEPVVSTPEPTPATPEVVAAIPEPAAPVAVETPTAPIVPEAAPETATTPVVTPEANSDDTTQAAAIASAPAAPEVVPTTEVPTTEVVTPEVATTTETPVTNSARAISNPPTIANRPNDQPLNIVNPTKELANTQVAAAPAPAPAPTAAASPTATPFSVQIASLPSQAAAQNTAGNLSRQFSSVIGNRALSIREAQIEGRGTFYRVRVGASSRDEANQLCGQIKAAGGDCFVTR